MSRKKTIKRIPKSWKKKRRKLTILFVLLFSMIMIVGFFAIRGKWFAVGEIDAKKVIPQFYNQSLEVSLGSKKLTVTPMAGNQVKVTQKDIRYIYENAYEKTDVIQTEYPYKIKEELIFYGKGHPLEFRYKLGNVDKFIIEKDEEGNIIFYDNKKAKGQSELTRIFTIPAPFIEDKITKRSFTAVKTVIDGDILVISIDPGWMEKAAYPVILDPTIEINIIDVHSSPETGENWDVSFITKGKADLKIIPDDQATIEEDEFVGLYCDDVKVDAQILENDVIYYPEWSCDGVGLIIHKTLRVGKHTLRFEYGGAVVYAYNNPYVTIDSAIDTGSARHLGASPNVVFVDDSTAYAFYADLNARCVYSKSTDGGSVWSAAVQADSLNTETCDGITVWYDQWTPGDSGGLIHIGTYASTSDDLYYTEFNTSGDVLSTTIEVTTGQGASLVYGTNQVSITKATDGALYLGTIDSSDSFVFKCASTCTTFANWSEAGSNPFTNGDDWMILMPQDSGNIMAIWWDISANYIYSKRYEPASSSWQESWTTINNAADDNTTYDGAFSATIDKNTYNIYFAFIDDASTLGAENDDILTYLYTNSTKTWSAKTDVSTNETRGITGVKIAFDENNDDIYVIYSARNSPYVGATANVYYKKSIDGMTTWIGEGGPLVTTDHGDIYGLRANFSSSYKIYVTWYEAALDDLFGDTIVDTAASIDMISVGTSGIQPASIYLPATDEHIGTFTFIRDSGSADVTQIVFNEEGTVNANSYISNLDVYYETADTCSYDGDETLFGTASVFNASDQATVTGTMAVGTSQICAYVLADVSSSAANTSLRIEISDPTSDITVSAGSIIQKPRILMHGGSYLREDDFADPVAVDEVVSVNVYTQSNNSTSSVFVNRDVGYAFYVDSDGTAKYSKTSDGGQTWGAGVTVDSQTDVQGIAIWYDKWTPGDTGGYIHIATFDSGNDDTWYARLDTSSDTVNTAVQVPSAGNTGSIAAASNNVSIVKATNGALYVGMSDDADYWVVTCTTTCTTNTNWTEITNPFDAAADFTYMAPLKDGDIMIIRYDISGNDYDYRKWDGANWSSWTTIVATAGENSTFDPHYGISINVLTYDIYLAYVDDSATLGASNDDIETYVCASGSWSAKTNVLTNDAKGIMNVALSIEQDTGTVYAAYSARDVAGLSTTGQIYWKRSTDGMGTWSDESEPLNDAESPTWGLGITMAPRERVYLIWCEDDYNRMVGATVFTVGGGPPIRIRGGTRIKGGTRLNLEDSQQNL
jgi:hypothetical protein